jgi:hypothetical protein
VIKNLLGKVFIFLFVFKTVMLIAESFHLPIKDFHWTLRPVRRSVSGLTQQSSVTVSWSWFDQSQGIVEWTFTNQGSQRESVILLRNGYYLVVPLVLFTWQTAHLCVQLALTVKGLEQAGYMLNQSKVVSP